jgi:hypothetical protein
MAKRRKAATRTAAKKSAKKSTKKTTKTRAKKTATGQKRKASQADMNFFDHLLKLFAGPDPRKK